MIQFPVLAHSVCCTRVRAGFGLSHNIRLIISNIVDIIRCMKTIASLFQSLNDETRLRILSLLLSEGELCVCDLVAVLQLPQSTVSRQISILKSAGWLKDRRDGVWIFYSIADGLGSIHQFLLPVLRNFLLTTDMAKADIERLHSFSNGNRCA